MNSRPIVFFLFILMVQPAMAIEEPEFEVLKATDDYEVRLYVPHIVAEVDVEGNDGDPGRKAFKILAGYIFGDNEAETKMSMTAPVTSQAGGEGEREHYTYAFFMESNVHNGHIAEAHGCQDQAGREAGARDRGAPLLWKVEYPQLSEARVRTDGGTG